MLFGDFFTLIWIHNVQYRNCRCQYRRAGVLENVLEWNSSVSAGNTTEVQLVSLSSSSKQERSDQILIYWRNTGASFQLNQLKVKIKWHHIAERDGEVDGGAADCEDDEDEDQRSWKPSSSLSVRFLVAACLQTKNRAEKTQSERLL